LTILKAVDKAKASRGGDPAALLIDLPRIRPVPKNDWAPPQYSISNRVELDEHTLVANRCVCFRPDAVELEPYKVLRTKIQHISRAKGWNTIMITSPKGCPEKTLTAVNLAMTFAKAFNQTVMLVDADLRRQQVHRLLGYDSGCGLADYLIDRRPLKELIVWPSIDQLTIISGSRSVSNSAELMGSERMRALVAELKGRYDDRMILFDSAPVLEGADALSLAALVDGIVVVVTEGETGMREVKRSLDALPADKLIGYALLQPSGPSGRKA
jgi:non-specific protein-tyrosine kinase